ncbi:DUF6049 family protein [Demequina sp. NBRC 110052]|uniref:DUF6049 family protein n=1 Tax=Demequina sp. NBRC 110052 TaxID=1570341 RepID=UPI0009FDD98E|nr:DUF6049 family protein [Demequina sp. NBRC 110052]
MRLTRQGLAALCLAAVAALATPVAATAGDVPLDSADEPVVPTLVASPPVTLGSGGVPALLAAPTESSEARMATAGMVSAEITGASPAVVMPSSTLRLTVALNNDTDAAVTGAELHIRLTSAPLTDQRQLEAFLADPGAFPRTTVATAPFGAGGRLLAGAMDAVSLALPASSLALPGGSWGVYGLSVTRVDATGATTLDAMVLTWADAEVPELSVNVAATVTGATARAEMTLAAASDSRVTLLVDPASADDDTVEDHEAFRVPAADVDLTSLAHAGDTRLLDVALTGPLTSGEPDLATLPWIAPVAIADEPTLAAAASAGATAVLLEPRFAAEALPGAKSATVAQVQTSEGPVAVIQPDATLTETLGSYRTGSPTATFRLVAESALIAGSGESDPVVIAPGQSWKIDSAIASSSITTLFSTPWVRPVPLATVLSDTGRVEATFASGGAEDDLSRPDVVRLGNAYENVAVVASAAERPDELLADHARDILRAASLVSRGTPHSRESLVENAIEAATETANAISVATSSELNLIAAEGFLPITVRNGLDQAVTVRVVVESSAVNLRVEGSPGATVPAGGELAVQVPFSAVSTANVDVSASATTLDGELLAPPQSLTVRVRADWGNAATLVFSALLVLLLVGGVVRTIRRGRRDTRLGPARAEQAAAPGDSDVTCAGDEAEAQPDRQDD